MSSHATNLPRQQHPTAAATPLPQSIMAEERETTIDDGTALQALHYYSMYASMEVDR